MLDAMGRVLALPEMETVNDKQKLEGLVPRAQSCDWRRLFREGLASKPGWLQQLVLMGPRFSPLS